MYATAAGIWFLRHLTTTAQLSRNIDLYLLLHMYQPTRSMQVTQSRLDDAVYVFTNRLADNAVSRQCYDDTFDRRL